MPAILEIASTVECLVSIVKLIAERGLTLKDENVGLPRNFFEAKFQKSK